MQSSIRFAAVSLLLLSSNALFMIGLSYLSSGGSSLEKLHPAFYIVCVGLLFYAIGSGSKIGDLRLRGMLSSICWMLFASISLVVWAAISPNAGGELTLSIVTFLMPALLMLLLTRASDETMNFVARMVAVFFVLNSILGLIGSFTGFNLIVQTAGDVIVRDPRPTGLLGHPLINSQMTGAWLLYVAMTAVKDGFRTRSFLECALHALALVAFGGRSALALVVLIMVVYTTYRAYHALLTGRLRSLISFLILLGALAVAVPLAVQWGVADVLLERIGDDRGSADTRLAALQLFSILDMNQILLGVGPSQRNYILLSLNTPNGIESFPLAIMLNYGMLAMLAVTITSFKALFKLARPIGAIGAGVVFYFLISSAASLSLGSKTISMSIFVLVIVAMRTQVLKPLITAQAKNDALAVPA